MPRLGITTARIGLQIIELSHGTHLTSVDIDGRSMLISEHLNYFFIIFLTPDTLKSNVKMGIILWITTPQGGTVARPRFRVPTNRPPHPDQASHHCTPAHLHQETHPMHFPGIPSSTTSQLWMDTS